MKIVDADNTGTFQANPDNLLSTSPQFYTASDAIAEAANSLRIAVEDASASWDGDAQKKLQILGRDYVKHLEALAKGMSDIALRLHQGAILMQDTEKHIAHSFDPNP